MLVKTITEQPSFLNFIRQEKSARRHLSLAIPAILIQLIVFKRFYPFANYFFTDSFGYLYAAGYNLDAHIWPIGYSKFLRLFNTFFHSDTALVCFQYIFLQLSGLYFLFTVCRLFRPSKLVGWIVWIAFIFNPLFLYLGNSISSDALFTGGSLLWMAQLMDLINHPSRRRIFIHALLLAGLFTIRYTAIYYPVVSVLAILLSAHTGKEKAIAIALPALLIMGFMYYTAGVNKETTGIRQFSPFGGWQLANNALYIYGHDRLRSPQPAPGLQALPGSQPAPDAQSKPGSQSAPILSSAPSQDAVPARFAELDARVHRYFDTAKNERTLLDRLYPGTFYLWSGQSPLAAYLPHRDTIKDDFYTNWASRSALYGDYGRWLIARHPLAYAKYYCWPNLLRYAFPPLEFMNQYNSGMDTVDRLTVAWFHYKDQRVKAFSPNIQARILAPYPFLSMLMNLGWIGLLALFLATPQIRRADPVFFRQLLLIGSAWLLHGCFSIVAAPVVLRYQVFSMILSSVGTLLLVGRLLQEDIKTTIHDTKKNNRRNLRFLPGILVRLHLHRQTLSAQSLPLPAGHLPLDPAHRRLDRLGPSAPGADDRGLADPGT